ncbi:LOW QUALITY PROTEIN: protein phosphatase Slingshot homolog 2 [Camarhynchus parvulus]|uniref:LOW QUALITY PROTEIN: protein phosphatase Slingshot homolog 2 n=1 Tax=Geospiza parvula TaxID=87175 RepID=UPI001237A92F|nr:LOW QUALITY PROTEIN: protein phosphatase Slingshot homolog 2 [Camarhynchus parvulus]
MALVTVQRSPTPSATSSPCASEADSGEEECRSQPRSISESFLTVKGAALFLPRGNGSSTPRISHRRNKHAGDLQQHLQAMFILLRPEDNIRLAVRLESTYQNRTRYMVVVSTNGRQDTEESIVLGMDFSSNDSSTCTMGLVLPLWSDTLIHLDGDGGFSVSTDNRVHIFKPVSVQAMWSALQSLHKACEVARSNNYYPGSLFLTWVSYYESHINSDQSSVNEWNAMQDVQSHRPDSPALFTDVPTERERTERLIKTKLREIMMQKDLENITSKEIRTELEMQMVCNLREFKEFIDNEMIVILGQMDSPTQIFDHVFLGSEWNASNLEDLQNRGVRYILNVTREIDNFFPGLFEYHNIRVYDEEATDLLAYWNDTYKFISKAKKNGSKCLVHCKMGVSRSASTVIAYAMKEYGWNLDRAYDYVKERRTVTKPNPSFMRQLEEYQGILLASKQRHNKLWRSHSDSDLSDHHEPICKAGLELNKKEITTSADQISEAKTNDNQQPMSPIYSAELEREQQLPEDTNMIEDVCVKERRIHLEFTCRDFHTEQMEDKLNLNNINGCTAGCCVDSVPPDNCRASEALMQLQHPLEITEFPDLTVDDLEKDALKPDMNVHLVPMEEFTSCLKDFPQSPNQNSLGLQQNPQPEVTDLSTDRIDFFSALEKFVELSQESRSRTCSHSRPEEQGTGRNGVSRVPVLEVPPAADGGADARRNSPGNSPQPSDDSSTDEEQQKEVPELPGAGHLTRSHSENAISVKEIITEIESINQGAGPAQQKEGSANLSQTPKRNTVHDLPVEVIWASEKLEQSEGACAGHQEKEKDPLPTEQEEAPSLQLSSGRSDLEESSSGGEQQEPRGSTKPEPKWCPGSVRRATLEFEERLRQEQEHQHTAPACTLPTRKNSRNDCPAAELLPRGKSEEPPLELPPEGDKAQEEPLLPAGAEQPVGRHLPAPLGAPAQESLPTEPSPGQEGAAQQRRTVVSFDGTEEPSLPPLLPKRIEIIEYTLTVKPAEQRPHTSCEQGGLAPATPSLDENLNPSMRLEKAPADPSPPEHAVRKQAAFTVGSPSKEGSGRSAHLGAASPSAQVTCPPAASLERSPYPCVIHLEGVTEQSTGTDDEPVTPCGTEGDATLPFKDGPKPLCGDSAGISRQLSSEDFSRQHAENMDLLDISFLCYSLPHSSSSLSVEERSSSPGPVKQRAKEIEARIRHAGLTRPSHMKLSASLAKLDRLELSKDDLHDRESASSNANPVLLTCVALGRGFCGGRSERGSESACGKHRLSSPEPTRHFVEQLRTAECIAQSMPVERPLAQYAKECSSSQQSLCSSADPTWTSSGEGPPLLQVQVLDSLSPSQALAVAPRQQHGRTHPLRRLKKTNDKKRTTNPLYNTM